MFVQATPFYSGGLLGGLCSRGSQLSAYECLEQGSAGSVGLGAIYDNFRLAGKCRDQLHQRPWRGISASLRHILSLLGVSSPKGFYKASCHSLHVKLFRQFIRINIQLHYPQPHLPSNFLYNSLPFYIHYNAVFSGSVAFGLYHRRSRRSS